MHLQVLVDTAYETKRVRSMLAENMAARMSLESQRREEVIVYNREQREKAAAQKAKVRVRAGRPATKFFVWLEPRSQQKTWRCGVGLYLVLAKSLYL